MVADTPTLLLMIIVASVVMGIAAWVVSGAQRQDEGLGWWAGAMFLHAAAFFLLNRRGLWPDMLGIVLANTLLACVFACVLEALFRFFRQTVPRLLVWVPVAVMALANHLLTDLSAERQLVGGVLFALPVLLALWLLRRHADATPGRGKYLLATSLILLLLEFAMRIVVSVGAPDSMREPLGNALVPGLSFVMSFAALTLGSFGFVFMTKERADARNLDLAMHDALTGVPNRCAVIQALGQQFSLAQRNEQPLSVLMLDIDHFKRINDCFGHSAGDEVLRSVAQCVAGRIREQDTVGRFGGEEFLVILPGTMPEGARQLAEILRETIAFDPVLTSWQEVGVTVSVGVAGGLINEAQEMDSLLEAADRALYRAKDDGRNCVEVA